MEYEFLKSLEVILIASAVVVFLLYKFKIPSLVGFINPEPDFRFKRADFILFTGDRKSMHEALNYFKGKT